MDKNIFWITVLSLFAAVFLIGTGVSLWNRRLAKAIREREKFARAVNDLKSQMASWIKIFPGAIYRCKPDEARTMVFVSDAILPITGYPALDFTARIRHFPNLIHPEDQALAAFQIGQGLKRARCFEVEYRIQRSDGEIRRILEKGVGSGRSGHNDTGCGYEWIDGIIMDITGPTQNEESLRLLNGMFRSLIDEMPDLIFFKDRKGVFLECNKAFAASAEKESDGIIGKTDYDLFSKELADRFRENDLKMLSKMKPRRSLGWLSRKDGQKMLMETLRTPLIDADDKVVGLVGVSRIKRLKAED
jgi:PAS domain S-box-containing protein